MPKSWRTGTRQRGHVAATDLTAGPTYVAPCEPVLVRTPPAGPDWLHEVKFDGYRMLSVIDAGNVRIHTRRGLDWTPRMPGIAQALSHLKLRSAVLDGEAIQGGRDGTPDFFALHAALAKRSAPDAILMLFDLLYLDGEDLRESPLTERRNMLLSLLRRPPPQLRFSHGLAGDGPVAFRAACEIGLEGIVSKRRNSPYRSGKSDAWRKAKCTTTEHFAVIGRDRSGRSLHLAQLVKGELKPCGSAGSGLSEAAVRQIRSALDASKPVVVEVEHRGFTPDGELRHPVVNQR
jgi:bifunctional non-homologous end joining protein LigD